MPVLGQSREYGWASSKERIIDTRPKGKKERVSLIAAITLKGHMAEQALVIPDTVNKNAFLCFLEATLLPTLPKGSVIIMDNWSAKHPAGTVHHGDDVRDLVDACGCELLYLPTYSPDLVLGKTAHHKGAKFQPPGPARNPIEHLFAKLKAFIKALRPDSTDKLIQAFCNATKTLTSENVRKSFEHCGYGVVQ